VAGLADSGIGRPLPLPPLWLPPVWLDGERLCWGVKNWDTPRETKVPNFDRLLPDFIALADGSSATILKFARTYGPLALCAKHEMPLFHVQECTTPAVRSSRPMPDLSSENVSEQRNREFIEGIVFSSSLPPWRYWATYVRALLQLAAATKAGEPGEPRDWRTILDGEPTDDADRRQLLATCANTLLKLGRPTPSVTLGRDGNLQLAFVNYGSVRTETGWAIAMRKGESPLSGTLFAAIAVAAAASLASGRALMRCCQCRTIYTPRRSPGPGELNFCRDCGARASWRLSKQRQRAARKKDNKVVPKGSEGFRSIGR
jgi:hypothetical protein